MTINEAAQILGIPLNATQAHLKKAYKKLVKKYHPDTNPGDNKAQEMMIKINDAYELFVTHLERGENQNTGGSAGTNTGQGSSQNAGGDAGRTGSTGVNIDSILKTFWQNYQRAKRDHENFIHGELAATRQKVKDTESRLVQADNLDKKLGYVQTLQRLLMQEKMQVARAVVLAKTAEVYLKQYQDASARFNQTNKQGGR